MFESVKLRIAISRIKKMEEIFDYLQKEFNQSVKNNSFDKLFKNKKFQKKLKIIETYYATKWKTDFFLDEVNKIPKKLKRGILSQDGIYNFLCKVSEIFNNQV